jgi:hypothetical protein
MGLIVKSVMHTHTTILLSVFALPLSSSAQMWMDFNSTQSSGGEPVLDDPTDPANAVHHEPGYLCYHARHEDPSSFVTASYQVEFSGTGAATVEMTPEWPNTTGPNVQQAIGRGGSQPDSWLGQNQNLLRDWIGADSRTGNGGNGAWDGTSGTPTYFQLRFAGLPGANYEMTAFFHDVEHMNAEFSLEVSTDGGTTFAEPILGRMTNSLSGGNPAENEVLPGEAPNVVDGDPTELSSTQIFTFEAFDGEEVVLRFAPLTPGGPVHRDFVGLNGFKLVQGEPAGPALEIIDLVRDPDGGEATLTWTSKPDALYAIRFSEDLTGNPAEWTVVETNVPSDGEETTFTDTTAGTRRFYVIEEL